MLLEQFDLAGKTKCISLCYKAVNNNSSEEALISSICIRGDEQSVALKFLLDRVGDKFSIPSSSLREMSCSCFYWIRMAIPCSHIISTTNAVSIISRTQDSKILFEFDSTKVDVQIPDLTSEVIDFAFQDS